MLNLTQPKVPFYLTKSEIKELLRIPDDPHRLRRALEHGIEEIEKLHERDKEYYVRRKIARTEQPEPEKVPEYARGIFDGWNAEQLQQFIQHMESENESTAKRDGISETEFDGEDELE